MLSSFRPGQLALVLAAICVCLRPAYGASAVSLPDVVRQTMKIYFTPMPDGKIDSVDKFAGSVKSYPEYRQGCGVFVTLSQNGKARACWGTLTPEYKRVGQATVYATIGALTKEYRFAPIKASEWRQLKVQVTVVKDVQSISSLSHLNPLADGLLVRAGGKSGVILPGECCDAYYQLVRARLKAGITSKEPCQMFRIAADVYR